MLIENGHIPTFGYFSLSKLSATTYYINYIYVCVEFKYEFFKYEKIHPSYLPILSF